MILFELLRGIYDDFINLKICLGSSLEVPTKVGQLCLYMFWKKNLKVLIRATQDRPTIANYTIQN